MVTGTGQGGDAPDHDEDGDEDGEGAAPTDRSGRRKLRAPTAQSLERLALWHLGRFETTRARLEQVMQRRVERAARAGLVDRKAAAGWIAAILDRLVAGGSVDDGRFARLHVRRLREGGASRRRVVAWLAERGVAAETAAAALDEAEDGAGDAERAAADRFARRRRLGPYRDAEERAEHRERDLAAMGRAGFGYAVARAVIEGDAEA